MQNPKTKSDESVTSSINSLQLILRRTSNIPYRILSLALHRLDLSCCALGLGALVAKLVDILVRLGYAF